ncbi:MAG: hypothetical protein ACFB20_06190 [Opitutales bacterium]
MKEASSTPTATDAASPSPKPASERGWPWLIVPWVGLLMAGAVALVGQFTVGLGENAVWFWLAAPGAYTVLKILTIALLAVRQNSFYLIVCACAFPAEALVVGLLTILLLQALEA